MQKTVRSQQALFQFRGIPPIGMTVSMALQHLVAMIVGCVTPAIIIAHTVGLPQSQRVLLIQASLVMSAVTTLLELFPIGGRFGAGLPVIFGVSFAYLPSMQAIASGGGLSAVAGAMIVGGVVATLVGIFIKPIRRLFPPVITGTVVFTIGLSLYPTAIHYMAGGAGNTYESVVTERGLTEALVYGSWQNWAVAAFTLAVVLVLTNHGKGICKLASIWRATPWRWRWVWWICPASARRRGSRCRRCCPSASPLSPPAASHWDCCSPSTPFRPSAT